MTTTVPTQPAAAPVLEPVRPFSELSGADVPFAGGKGANLGQLTRSGFPVPPGFVVGATAYAAFRSETGLSERLDAVLEDLDVDDIEALQRAARPGGGARARRGPGARRPLRRLARR
jgi:Pyruvate phosphate dikinase, AMP/ATP-binding domain